MEQGEIPSRGAGWLSPTLNSYFSLYVYEELFLKFLPLRFPWL